MKGRGERNSIFRKGKGRALLRFLIGELMLFIVCSLAYMFIIRGVGVPVVPASTPTARPTAEMTPIPQPSPTPIPSELFASKVLTLEVPQPRDAVAYVLIDVKEINSDTQTALSLTANAYIMGEDAAQSTTYLVLLNGGDGTAEAVYETERIEDRSGLEYDESKGTNLDQSCFSAVIDMAEYPDGQYRLGILVVNGERQEYAPVDGGYGFVMQNGVLIRQTAATD